MTDATRARVLGLAVVGGALALIFAVIPSGIQVGPGPTILRPDLWPRAISWLLLAAGLALTAQGFLATPARTEREPDADASPVPGRLRLAGFALVLLWLAFATPALGMVWTSIGAFWACIALARPTRRLLIPALVVGAVLPLALYAFFAHFAGVPIPQGQVVRLP